MTLRQRKQILELYGYKTSYIQKGDGHPAIVLLSGLGEACDSWEPVFDQLAEHTKVFAYDRPGYGKSQNVRHDGNGRDGEFVATHLKACLDAAEVAAPYIIVGHSIGGLYALCYANYFPNDVSGLVLLDARAPTFSAAAERHKPGSSQPSHILALLFPQRIKAEVKGAEAAERQAAVPESLGEIPVTIIAASKPSPGVDEAFHDVWVGEQRAYASRLTNGQFIVADESGHEIHRDRPDLVMQEIMSVLERVAASQQESPTR